jgi:hypothetical protein
VDPDVDFITIDLSFSTREQLQEPI